MTPDPLWWSLALAALVGAGVTVWAVGVWCRRWLHRAVALVRGWS